MAVKSLFSVCFRRLPMKEWIRDRHDDTDSNWDPNMSINQSLMRFKGEVQSEIGKEC